VSSSKSLINNQILILTVAEVEKNKDNVLADSASREPALWFIAS
jgi:hypothetical protein